MRAALWLIGAILLLDRPRGAAASSTSKRSPSPAPTTPTPIAHLYQLPRDGFETVRVAVAARPGARPVEMGIFSNATNAMQVVSSKGWALAWPGVRQLEERP